MSRLVRRLIHQTLQEDAKARPESAAPRARMRQQGLQQQQAQERPNALVGYGSIVGGAAGAINYQSGCVMARTGLGIYTCTLDAQYGLTLANLGYDVNFAGSAADKLVYNVTIAQVAGQTVLTINTFVATTGAAGDPAGSLLIKVWGLGAAGIN